MSVLTAVLIVLVGWSQAKALLPARLHDLPALEQKLSTTPVVTVTRHASCSSTPPGTLPVYGWISTNGSTIRYTFTTPNTNGIFTAGLPQDGGADPGDSSPNSSLAHPGPGEQLVAFDYGPSVILQQGSSTVTIKDGSQTIFAGQTVSALSDGSGVVIVQSSTATFSPSSTLAILTVGSHTLTALDQDGSVIINEGTSTITVQDGSSTTFASQAISILQSGSGIAVGSSTTSIFGPRSTQAVPTADPNLISAVPSAGSVALGYGSSSVLLGHGSQTVFGGQTVSALPNGSGVVFGGSVTRTFQSEPTNPAVSATGNAQPVQVSTPVAATATQAGGSGSASPSTSTSATESSDLSCPTPRASYAYTDPDSGSEFQVQCNTTYSGSVFAVSVEEDVGSCIARCSDDVNCDAAGFDAETGLCYQYNALAAGNGVFSPKMQFAQVRGRMVNVGGSSSSLVSVTISAYTVSSIATMFPSSGVSTRWNLDGGSPGTAASQAGSGASNAQPSATGLAEVTLALSDVNAATAFPGASASIVAGFVVSGTTLLPGSSATISGTTYSLPATGSGVYIDGQYQSIPTSAPGVPITLPNSVVATPTTLSDVILGSQTLVPGGSPITVSGTVYTLGPNEIPSSVPSVLTIDGVQITATSNEPNALPTYIVHGQTLTPGGAITYDNSMSILSLDSAGATLAFVDGASTVVSQVGLNTGVIATLPSTPQSSVALPGPAASATASLARPTLPPVLTIGDQLFTADTSNGGYGPFWTIAGQTLTPGGTITTRNGEGIQTISLDPAGTAVAFIAADAATTSQISSAIQDEASTRLYSPASSLPVSEATAGAEPAETPYVIGGQTLSPGGLITISDEDGLETLSLGPSGTEIVAIESGTTATYQIIPSSTPIISAGQAATLPTPTTQQNPSLLSPANQPSITTNPSQTSSISPPPAGPLSLLITGGTTITAQLGGSTITLVRSGSTILTTPPGSAYTTFLKGETLIHTSPATPFLTITGGTTRTLTLGGIQTTYIANGTTTLAAIPTSNIPSASASASPSAVAVAIAEAPIGACPAFNGMLVGSSLVTCGNIYEGSSWVPDAQAGIGAVGCDTACVSSSECVGFSYTEANCSLFDLVTGIRANNVPSYSALRLRSRVVNLGNGASSSSSTSTSGAGGLLGALSSLLLPLSGSTSTRLSTSLLSGAGGSNTVSVSSTATFRSGTGSGSSRSASGSAGTGQQQSSSVSTGSASSTPTISARSATVGSGSSTAASSSGSIELSSITPLASSGSSQTSRGILASSSGASPSAMSSAVSGATSRSGAGLSSIGQSTTLVPGSSASPTVPSDVPLGFVSTQINGSISGLITSVVRSSSFANSPGVSQSSSPGVDSIVSSSPASASFPGTTSTSLTGRESSDSISPVSTASSTQSSSGASGVDQLSFSTIAASAISTPGLISTTSTITNSNSGEGSPSVESPSQPSTPSSFSPSLPTSIAISVSSQDISATTFLDAIVSFASPRSGASSLFPASDIPGLSSSAVNGPLSTSGSFSLSLSLGLSAQSFNTGSVSGTSQVIGTSSALSTIDISGPGVQTGVFSSSAVTTPAPELNSGSSISAQSSPLSNLVSETSSVDASGLPITVVSTADPVVGLSASSISGQAPLVSMTSSSGDFNMSLESLAISASLTPAISATQSLGSANGVSVSSGTLGSNLGGLSAFSSAVVSSGLANLSSMAATQPGTSLSGSMVPTGSIGDQSVPTPSGLSAVSLSGGITSLASNSEGAAISVASVSSGQNTGSLSLTALSIGPSTTGVNEGSSSSAGGAILPPVAISSTFPIGNSATYISANAGSSEDGAISSAFITSVESLTTSSITSPGVSSAFTVIWITGGSTETYISSSSTYTMVNNGVPITSVGFGTAPTGLPCQSECEISSATSVVESSQTSGGDLLPASSAGSSFDSAASLIFSSAPSLTGSGSTATPSSTSCSQAPGQALSNGAFCDSDLSSWETSTNTPASNVSVVDQRLTMTFSSSDTLSDETLWALQRVDARVGQTYRMRANVRIAIPPGSSTSSWTVAVQLGNNTVFLTTGPSSNNFLIDETGVLGFGAETLRLRATYSGVEAAVVSWDDVYLSLSEADVSASGTTFAGGVPLATALAESQTITNSLSVSTAVAVSAGVAVSLSVSTTGSDLTGLMLPASATLISSDQGNESSLLSSVLSTSTLPVLESLNTATPLSTDLAIPLSPSTNDGSESLSLGLPTSALPENTVNPSLALNGASSSDESTALSPTLASSVPSLAGISIPSPTPPITIGSTTAGSDALGSLQSLASSIGATGTFTLPVAISSSDVSAGFALSSSSLGLDTGVDGSAATSAFASIGSGIASLASTRSVDLVTASLASEIYTLSTPLFVGDDPNSIIGDLTLPSSSLSSVGETTELTAPAFASGLGGSSLELILPSSSPDGIGDTTKFLTSPAFTGSLSVSSLELPLLSTGPSIGASAVTQLSPTITALAGTSALDSTLPTDTTGLPLPVNTSAITSIFTLTESISVGTLFDTAVIDVSVTSGLSSLLSGGLSTTLSSNALSNITAITKSTALGSSLLESAPTAPADASGLPSVANVSTSVATTSLGGSILAAPSISSTPKLSSLVPNSLSTAPSLPSISVNIFNITASTSRSTSLSSSIVSSSPSSQSSQLPVVCPADTTYNTTDGSQYSIVCDRSYSTQRLAVTDAPTLESCIDQCSEEALCMGTTYSASNGSCHLSSGMVPTTQRTTGTYSVLRVAAPRAAQSQTEAIANSNFANDTLSPWVADGVGNASVFSAADNMATADFNLAAPNEISSSSTAIENSSGQLTASNPSSTIAGGLSPTTPIPTSRATVWLFQRLRVPTGNVYAVAMTLELTSGGENECLVGMQTELQSVMQYSFTNGSSYSGTVNATGSNTAADSEWVMVFGSCEGDSNARMRVTDITWNTWPSDAMTSNSSEPELSASSASVPVPLASVVSDFSALVDASPSPISVDLPPPDVVSTGLLTSDLVFGPTSVPAQPAGPLTLSSGAGDFEASLSSALPTGPDITSLAALSSASLTTPNPLVLPTRSQPIPTAPSLDSALDTALNSLLSALSLPFATTTPSVSIPELPTVSPPVLTVISRESLPIDPSTPATSLISSGYALEGLASAILSSAALSTQIPSVAISDAFPPTLPDFTSPLIGQSSPILVAPTISPGLPTLPQLSVSASISASISVAVSASIPDLALPTVSSLTLPLIGQSSPILVIPTVGPGPTALPVPSISASVSASISVAVSASDLVGIPPEAVASVLSLLSATGFATFVSPPVVLPSLTGVATVPSPVISSTSLALPSPLGTSVIGGSPTLAIPALPTTSPSNPSLTSAALPSIALPGTTVLLSPSLVASSPIISVPQIPVTSSLSPIVGATTALSALLPPSPSSASAAQSSTRPTTSNLLAIRSTTLSTASASSTAQPALLCPQNNGAIWTGRDGSRYLLNCAGVYDTVTIPGLPAFLTVSLAACADFCVLQGTQCQGVTWEPASRQCRMKTNISPVSNSTVPASYGLLRISAGVSVSTEILVNGAFDAGINAWTTITTGVSALVANLLTLVLGLVNGTVSCLISLSGLYALLGALTGSLNLYVYQAVSVAAGTNWFLSADLGLIHAQLTTDTSCWIYFQTDAEVIWSYWYDRTSTNGTIYGSGILTSLATQFQARAQCNGTTDVTISFDNLSWKTSPNLPGSNPMLLPPISILSNSAFTSPSLAPWTISPSTSPNVDTALQSGAALMSFNRIVNSPSTSPAQLLQTFNTTALANQNFLLTATVKVTIQTGLLGLSTATCALSIGLDGAMVWMDSTITTQTFLVHKRGTLGGDAKGINLNANCWGTKAAVVVWDDVYLTLNPA